MRGLSLLSALALSTATAGLADGPGDVTEAEAQAEEIRVAMERSVVEARNRVDVYIGQSVTVAVSRGHVNRIAVPFPRFDIQTSSPETIQIRQHVFYVTPSADAPISMFITPEGSEELAIQLNLAPSAIPPQQIDLVFAEDVGALVPAAFSAPEAAEGGMPATASPNVHPAEHERAVVGALKALVRGEIPEDYVPTAIGPVHPQCQLYPGWRVAFAEGQRFVGSAYDVYVGVVTREGARAGGFEEQWCGAPDVAAVALSPSAQLDPGQSAEIFVVRRRAAPVAANAPDPQRYRPTLVRARP